MGSVLDIARRYASGGLSVIPILADGSKKPVYAWKRFQSTPATPALLTQWFAGADNFGLAIVCGQVSGGLEVIDFDDARTFEQWRELVGQELPGLLARLPVVRTPSGGAHVYYRCAKPEPNRKLAWPAAGDKALIETRGEGGYVLAPGCPPACHPSGCLYELVSGPGLDDVPFLPETE